MEQIHVTSHVGRDLLQSAALFKHEHSVVWEYVANGLEYVEPGTKPIVKVKTDAKNGKISIADNGRGMSWEGLRNFFIMHGENIDRKQGRAGRGMFGTGKSAVFGIANVLRVTSVHNNNLSVVELHREDIEKMEGGDDVPVRTIKKEESTIEPNGTLIEIEEIQLRKIDPSTIIRHIERHVSHWPDATVFVNHSECQFVEPPVANEYRFQTTGHAVEATIGDVELIVKVAKAPLEDELQGITILSKGAWHETTLAGAERKPFANYIFGEIDVPAIQEDDSPIPPFDMSRSMQLNLNNAVVTAVFAFVGQHVNQIRRELEDADRERRKAEKAKKLAKEAEAIAEIINSDFTSWRDRIKQMQARMSGGSDLIPEKGPKLAEGENFIFGGDEPAEIVDDTGDPGHGEGNGGGGKEIPELGPQEYGITRERVRQIAAKTEKTIQRLGLVCPKLDEMASYLEERAPEFEEIVCAGVASVGITEFSFRVDGILKAFDILKFDCPIFQTEVEGFLIVVPNDWGFGRKVLRFMRLARRLSRPHGCVNFDDLIERVEIVRDQERQFLEKLVSRHDDLEWLDQDKKWLWQVSSDEIGRNRLINVLRKMFSVACSLHVSEIRQGFSRFHRIKIVPPRHVLLELCRQLDFLQVEGNQVRTTSGTKLPSTLSWLESTLVDAFGENAVQSREILEANALALGMNRSSFYVLIGYSPILVRLAKGVYAPVGADISPGAVEAFRKPVTRKKRLIDLGWSEGKILWIAYRLSESMVRDGLFAVPAAVKEFLQGEWLLDVDDDEIAPVVRINESKIWGLTNAIKRRGAEVDDVVVFVFDLQQRKFRFELGGEELLERWQTGMSELIDEGLTDLSGDEQT